MRREITAADGAASCSFVFEATPLAILIRDLVTPLAAGETLCAGAEL